MSSRKPSARAERRERARAGEKLARGRERLARLDPGGTPEHPVEVESASQIEPHALCLPCPSCGAVPRLDEHAAVTVGEIRLRRVTLRCPRCDGRREVWFRIAWQLPS